MNRTSLSRDWAPALALTGLCVVLLLGSYWGTALSMYAIWCRSETFTHGFLVLPISAYLIWTRRESVARFTPQPEFLPLALLAGAAFVWFVSNSIGILVLEQYSFVAMVPLLVWIVLGSNIARALAFPLFFLVFSVPAGEILAPALMELTADSTVFLLTASGIPVVRDGLSFSTSDARWSVVEACSGLRYLIASLALGSLFAHLFYNDWIKRALFIAAAAALPIAANCLRAYAIVLIGHASSMKLAAGVDHFIYGWIFFALVVGSLFWVGLMFRDTPRNADRVPSRASHRPRPRTVFGAAMAAAGITASAPALAAYSAQFDTTEPARSLSAPEPANGWKKSSEAGAVFTPHFLNAWASTQQTYKKGDDVVTLFIAYYRNQRAHGEMINSQNVVVFREQKVWRKTSEGRVVHPFPMNQTEVSNGEIKLVVWHWYWVNHTYAADTMRAKLLQAQSQLFRGKDEAAAIFVSSQGNAMAMRDFLSSVDIKRALEDASRN